MSPLNHSNEDNPGIFPKTIAIHITVFLVLDFMLTIATVLANGVFIVTLIKRRPLHTPSNMLLGALCCSDLFIGLIVQPFFLTYFLTVRVSQYMIPEIKEARDILFDTSFGLSFTFVILISLDRYAAICHPYKYHAKATCKTHLCLSLACGISVTSLYSYLSYEANSPNAAFGFAIYLRLAHYMAPFVTIILNYVRIYHVILKQRRTQVSIGDFSDNTRQELVKKKREKDKASFIAVILVCFFVCYGPGFLLAVIKLTMDITNSEDLFIASIWTNFMLFLSSFLNPIVYYLKSKEIRTEAKRMVLLRHMLGN